MTGGPCPGGSRPKPGFENDIAWQGTSLNALLQAAAPTLVAYLSVMAPFILNGREFCAAPPPTLPTWSLADINALVLGGPSVILRQTLNTFAWYYMCECSTEPTPAAPPLSLPPGATVLVDQPAAPCLVANGQIAPMTQAVETIIPAAPPPVGGNRLALPVGATHIRLSAQIDSLGSDLTHARIFTSLQDGPAGPGAGLPNLVITPPAREGQITYELDAGMTGIQIEHQVATHVSDVAAGNNVSASIEVYCGQPPGFAQAECCPPDPGIVAILRDLQLQVALLVARAGPTGPLEVLSANAISSEGTQVIQLGARMIEVELHELGANTSFVPYANPDRVMRAGTIRFGNDFGWRRREHVDNVNCLFPVPADATVVSWSLSPGTSGDLVQLGEPR